MKTRTALAIGWMLVCVASAGRAQAEAVAPLDPQAAKSADAQEHGSEDPAWQGPRVALSYRVFGMRDFQGGRVAQAAAFSGFLPTRFLRAGGSLSAGGRRYAHGPSEGLLSGSVFAGYQHLRDLGRLLPYLVAVGEYGVTFGKRFHTPLSRSFRGAGLELGADLNLVRSLHVGLGLTFMLYTMEGLRYEAFGLRLSIGL
jgi:hypothetical protein